MSADRSDPPHTQATITAVLLVIGLAVLFVPKGQRGPAALIESRCG